MTRYPAHRLAVGPAAAALAAVAMLGAGTGAAQEDGQVTIDASRCAELASPEERLACYEAQIEAARAAPPEPEPAPARAASDASAAEDTPAEERVAAPQPDERFGLREPETRDPERSEMYATVASVREREPNQYVITLENGQVWYQNVPQNYPQLQPGARVRLYSTRWGSSYRLTVEDRGYIQVERVR